MKATYTLVIALLLAAPGCSGCGRADQAGSCSQGGRTYHAGETFSAEDGCNTCTCMADSSVVCTKRPCEASCTHQGKRYTAGEEFPAADGCNSCTCAPDGAVHCTQHRCPVASSPWLSMEPKQCHNNPWERTPAAASGAARDYPVDELTAIDRYFRQQGITLKELGLVKPGKPRMVCEACSCPRGDRLLVRAEAKDGPALGRHGFAAAPMKEVLGYEPRQCRNNPWETPGGGTTDDEMQQVLRWAEGLGATLKELGPVYPTERRVVCTACSCPRGDRLVVYPATDQAVRVMQQHGFTTLPVE